MKLRTLLSPLLAGLALGSLHAEESIRLASYPEISPDGNTILFAWKGDIWQAAAAGGEVTRVTTHPAADFAPKFTPDGKSICFGSTREGGYQIFIMPATGGHARQITHHTEGSFLEDISADGKSLLVRGLRDHTGRKPYRLYRVAIDGESVEKMVFPAYGENGRFSADGKSVIFTREGAPLYRKGYHGTQASQVWTWNASGGGKFNQPISNDRKSFGCRTPLPHPNGSGFYYTLGSPNGFQLWFHGNDGADKQITHFADDSVMQPAISRNGSKLIFRHLFDLYTLDTSSGEGIQPQKLKLFHKEDLEETLNPQLAIKSTSDASFSPSGLEIVFTAENDLWAMDTILRKPRRLTNTPGHEKDVWFSHDGKTILYLYDDGVNTEIRRLAKPDATGFWWEAENCTHTVVVKSSERPDGILPGPKGKKIAYTTYPGSLWVSNPDGTEPTRLVESWNAPRAEWSPDGKWLTYSMQDDDFNSDIYIIPADGSSAPVNISRHPDSDLSPAWSPDGRRLAFIGRHHKESYDIFFVDLYAKDEVKDKDGETRERAKKAMKGDPNYRGSAKKTVKKVVKKITGENKKKEPETFNLTNIQQRVQRIQVKGGPAYQLMWYSDSKRLLFQSRGGKTTYSIEAKPGAAPKKFADASGSVIRMTSKGKIFWLSGGVPAVLSGGRNTKYPFSIYTQRDHKEWKRMMFRTAWNTMRDSFYDPAMNNRNWQSVLEKYEEAATYAPNSATFDRIANMMLGELNASHMGCRSKTWPASWKKQVRWTESTVHLGLRFDPSHQGKGWKVSQVIPRSPADREISRVEAGETILTVNGTEVSSSTPLASVLTLRTGELVHLTVSNKDGEERKVKIQPISYSAARSLASKAGINATAKATDELSGGKLGYIHIARMMWDEFEKFEHHLYEQGAGKEGLVIDVRDNGGGFTTDHLLTALCQPRHAYTIPRNGGIGYPQDRIVYATWNKPIIVLCNQNSFSNAEIFAHAIRTLGRGKVVGVTTAGGVISTGSTTIMGTASLRLPFRGWFNSETGEDMELDGAKPHITIWNQPGELSRGKDVQLEKAVKLLIADTTRAKQAPKPKYQSKR